MLNQLYKYKDTITSLDKAVELKPDYADTYWNNPRLSKDISDAFNNLSKTLIVDPFHTKGLITISGLRSIMGCADDLHALDHTKFPRYALKFSFDWFFNLNTAPKVYFSR
jgi:hypothetical protein